VGGPPGEKITWRKVSARGTNLAAGPKKTMTSGRKTRNEISDLTKGKTGEEGRMQPAGQKECLYTDHWTNITRATKRFKGLKEDAVNSWWAKILKTY